LLGAAVSFLPLRPFAEVQFFDKPIAQVFGYESMYTIAIGIIFTSVFLLLFATSFIEPVPLWRSVFIICAGIAVTLVMLGGLAAHRPSVDILHAEPVDDIWPGLGPGNFRVHVLGVNLTMDYQTKVVDSAKRLLAVNFQGWGLHTMVQMPEGQRLRPDQIKVVIKFAVYTIFSPSVSVLCSLEPYKCEQC
jgi:hypothetical protein